MCVMEIRSGQRNSTMAQAVAHNVGTVLGDLEMFHRVLEHRDPDNIPELEEVQAALRTIYARMLDLYGNCVACEVIPEHDHDHYGAERELVVEAAKVAGDDIKRARRYETR